MIRAAAFDSIAEPMRQAGVIAGVGFAAVFPAEGQHFPRVVAVGDWAALSQLSARDIHGSESSRGQPPAILDRRQ